MILKMMTCSTMIKVLKKDSGKKTIMIKPRTTWITLKKKTNPMKIWCIRVLMKITSKLKKVNSLKRT